jgi:hypothetical protein
MAGCHPSLRNEMQILSNEMPAEKPYLILSIIIKIILNP